MNRDSLVGRDYVLFYLNGERKEVRGELAMLPLALFLREEMNLKGTKIVCAEGDCGACSVLKISYPLTIEVVNSCIAPTYLFDCTEVITVEGIQKGESLNAIQEAMVLHHGTQCGFCTPGFVIALTSFFAKKQQQFLKQHFLNNEDDVNIDEIRECIVGNLCRCTGYLGIVEAAKSIEWWKYPFLLEQFSHEDYFKELTRVYDIPLKIETREKSVYAPKTLKEAVLYKNGDKDSDKGTIVSSATDLGVLVNKGKINLTKQLSLHLLPDLKLIHIHDGKELEIGARVTLSEFEERCKKDIPEVAKLMKNFASPQIKNMGTLVGNIANASPIGDTLPFLLVLNASLTIYGLQGERRVLLNDFYKGYKQIDLRGDEIITKVHIPVPSKESIFKIYKVSRRESLDISTISAAFLLELSNESKKIKTIKIAYGGVGPTPMRFKRSEAYLEGKNLDVDELFGKNSEKEKTTSFQELFLSEFSPLSDVRGSASYRKVVAENLFKKMIREIL